MHGKLTVNVMLKKVDQMTMKKNESGLITYALLF